jgi:DsbC/DsbD-like thiol-disulfide interchange protein
MKVVVALVLLTSTAYADRQIVDNNTSVTVDCKKDSEVSLVGNNLTVTLVGSCTRVNVTGNREKVTGSATAFFVGGSHNTITADSTDDITLAGSHNTVTWKKSGKGSPKVTNPGKDNKVSQAQ